MMHLMDLPDELIAAYTLLHSGYSACKMERKKATHPARDV